MMTAMPRSWNARTSCLELLPLRPGLRVPRTEAALHREGVGRAVPPLVVLAIDPHGLREGVVGERGLPLGVGVVEVLLHRHEVDHVHAQLSEVIEADGLAVRIHQTRPAIAVSVPVSASRREAGR